MAKQILNTFKFNPALNDALKTRFNAKWDKAAGAWTVSSAAKAAEANALIAQVAAFETNRMIQTGGGVELNSRFNETHPGFVEFHPVTGATWRFMTVELWAKATGVDPATAKAEFNAMKAEMGIE